MELTETDLENRAILAAFPHPVFILDETGALSQQNPQAERLVNALGIPGQLPARVNAHYQIARDSEENYLPEDPSESVLIRLQDREIYYLPRIFRIRGRRHEPRGWAVVLLDVSRFRWLDEMKTDLLSTLSHEIKTPLTGIRLVLHLLLEERTGPLNPKQRTALDSARRDCERLLETLHRLLELARAERGAEHLDLEVVRPDRLVADARDSFAGAAARPDVRLQTEIPVALPPVRADLSRMRQVFHNLLSNAFKYSPRGGTVHLSAGLRGSDFVRFRVRDEGPGVPEEARDQIFDKFYRAANQSLEGIGLGLSICREIVRAHDGRIGLETHPGEPTVFYFDLPLEGDF